MVRVKATALLLPLLVGAAWSGCFDQSPQDALLPDVTNTKPIPYIPGDYSFDGVFSQVLYPGPYGREPPVLEILKSEIDGVDIEIGYWRPSVEEGAKVPVLVLASPYHRPAGAVVQEIGSKRFLLQNFVAHGYAVAAVSVRGTAGSGGCMELMGSKEVADLDQAVTWLGTRPWSNGNVGMIGLSYDGSTPWAVAAIGNPHLKTIVPMSGVNDFYRLMYKNGTAELRGIVLLNLLYYEYGWNVVTPVGGGSDLNRTPEQRLEGLICPEAWNGLAWSGYSTVDGGRDPQGWWEQRNLRPLVERNYKGSILNVHGLQDWNVDPSMSQPWIDQLNASGLPVHQILGQWRHSPPDRKAEGPENFTSPNRMDFAEKLLHWFDYWLRGTETSDLGPSVTVQDHTLRWRMEDHWPPRDSTWTTYHLSIDSHLATEKGGTAGRVTLVPHPVGDEPLDPYVDDVPGYAADFYTAPFEETVNIAGLPRVHVTVSPQGPSGHLAAWLYDVDSTGKATRIGWTTMNLRFYDGDENAHSLSPGQPIVAKMEIQPMDARVEAGHRVMLRLWQYSSDDHLGVPLVKDRNSPIPSQTVDVLFGGEAASIVELPTVQRPEADYFRPPTPPDFEYPYEE